MALNPVRSRFGRAVWGDLSPCLRSVRPFGARNASSEATADLEASSSLAAPPPDDEMIKSWDPVARHRDRNVKLPSSRYKFRSPRYNRGPLHPHQPLPDHDPASRSFIPGPFHYPRMQQTYDSTVEADLMTLQYQHYPPGYKPPPKAPRLREWVGDSPYFKNRPLRGPRGSDVLRLLRRRTTFRNVPEVTGITVHTMVKGATQSSAYLHVAGMIVQAITNVKVKTHKVKTGAAQWGLRAGKYIAVTAELEREDMYDFLAKTVDLVMPKIKDFKGAKGTSGDNSGNIAFGLTPEAVAMYPEIVVNYDAYPPRMIPGCHVIVKTSATNDKEARLLLSALGIPFYGKQVN
ncbi:ribosomal protein L5 [Saccharata proteae CBS 121410]|uniref:Ribosomal protein L5 n=1 Tax=Saccharata proteae CBS 121410 TaxID=1314787 RepID=A0A9P4LWW1_9PEZI|nr:ribosomal protein L5 [Saccharata proteae CBS 121410]